MAWDFETEPEFQMQLDWVDRFVRDEVEPLDLVLRCPVTLITTITIVHCLYALYLLQ